MSFDPGKQQAIFHSRLRIIRSLLDEYDGTTPFHHYLTSCFQKHKNFGSRDRRIYSSWCFSFFRFGKALTGHEFPTRLMVAWYLVHGATDELFQFLNNDVIPGGDWGTLDDRVTLISKIFPEFRVEDIFPFFSKISDGISVSDYALSMLRQPSVWIRIVKGKENLVEEELFSKEIKFTKSDLLPNAWSFEPGVKLDMLTAKGKRYFEIQDLSSQIAGTGIPAKAGEHWWDCCCGAGGKSLDLFDLVPDLHITATDSRASILRNFRERTEQYQSRLSTTVLDLEQPVGANFFGVRFDGIVADVPCSGSGTWSRNPENLVHFNEERISNFTSRQKNIISNALPFLKPAGTLVYITCSVFKTENEEVVAWIASLPGIKLVKQHFINGVSNYSDSMFYAEFIKR